MAKLKKRNYSNQGGGRTYYGQSAGKVVSAMGNTLFQTANIPIQRVITTITKGSKAASKDTSRRLEELTDSNIEKLSEHELKYKKK